MSVRATTWALYDVPELAPDLDPTARLVLLVLADQVDHMGQGCWTSNRTIALAVGASVRTVQRRLAELRDAGLIKYGDQRLVSHLRSDRKPTVWDLCLGLGGRYIDTNPGARA